MENTNDGFEQFDVVSNDTDHHYYSVGSNNRACFTDTKSGIYRTIMKEWKILQRNLPESIYVRVYERRIDLMRAVIVGAAGTPYHDGLFFFDIRFPCNYPNQPPEVHYQSFGYPVNPNLYPSGKVCLSLLNTGPTGKKMEMWVPSKSTILQVLVSIQGLVLNEKPLFNVPVAQNLRYFLENYSREINERMFIYSLKSYSALLRKPPKNFEEFVRDHFRERAFPILAACVAYVDERVRVGFYSYNSPRSSSSRVRVSRDFKKQMKELYPRLFKEFQRNGVSASLEGLVQHLDHVCDKSRNRTAIFNKVREKIKRILGLRKKVK